MKHNTEVIYKQKSNYIFDYINANLHNPIQLNLIAKQVNVSKRQLLRIMCNYLNEPLYVYITRLRMERAIMYMQTEKMSLTRLSGLVGYESSHSFSKAFKKQYNISPKVYLQKIYDQLKEQVKISDTTTKIISYEEVSIKTINLVYIRIIGKYGDDEAYYKGWAKLTDFLKKKDLLNKLTQFIGISLDDPNITQAKQCRFYACASIDNYISGEGEFGTISIPSGKYAVYVLKGSYSQLQNLYNQISLDLNLKIRHGISFEEYINSPENTKEKDLITKIYIPIK